MARRESYAGFCERQAFFGLIGAHAHSGEYSILERRQGSHAGDQ